MPLVNQRAAHVGWELEEAVDLAVEMSLCAKQSVFTDGRGLGWACPLLRLDLHPLKAFHQDMLILLFYVLDVVCEDVAAGLAHLEGATVFGLEGGAMAPGTDISVCLISVVCCERKCILQDVERGKRVKA